MAEFPHITNRDQRQRYRNLYRDEFEGEYKKLTAEITAVTKQFSDMEKMLKRLDPGSEQHKVRELYQLELKAKVCKVSTTFSGNVLGHPMMISSQKSCNLSIYQ